MNEVVTTDDGSSSVLSQQFGVLYHSNRGAVGEANHLFIRFLADNDSVLEVGLGTGLNALLALQSGLEIDYVAVELYEIESSLLPQLSFCCDQLRQIHAAPWGEKTELTPNFSITKLKVDLAQYIPDQKFNKIFFDAFAPETQPEMWSAPIFEKLYNALETGGFLTTYCAKGDVKRTLRQVGFTVERLPGALGKRHMLRATKGV